MKELAKIKATIKKKKALEFELVHLVIEARMNGAKWQEIADALGCTRQAVHEKYGKYFEITKTVKIREDLIQ